MATEWPSSLCPNEMTWGMVYNNRAFTSTLSNAQQVVGYPGAYWQCTLTFNGMTRDKERRLSALMGKLQGMLGTVNMPAFTRRRVDSIGTAVVVTGNAQSSVMTIGGVTPSVRVFSFGDYISVNGEMFEVVEDAVATSQGQVLVNLNKRIRKALTAGAPVEYRNPFSEMRRTEDTNSFTIQPMVASGTIQLREAF